METIGVIGRRPDDGVNFLNGTPTWAEISAILKSEYIIYTIEDNGVGRKKSSDYNALNKPHHNSLGLQITEQRISIFNEQYQANSTLNIEDLVDENEQPHGTRVTLKIKTV